MLTDANVNQWAHIHMDSIKAQLGVESLLGITDLPPTS